jgi:hypothetical protein
MGKKVNKSGLKYYIVIGVLGVFAVGGLILAGADAVSTVINVSGDYNFNESEQVAEPIINDELGAFPGGDIYTPVNFKDELITNGSINIPLNWAQSTSTGVGTQYLVLGKYQYKGTDTLVCNGSGNGSTIYVSGVVPYTASYRLGTTTCQTATSRTCGDGTTSFTATTSQGIITKVQVATSTATDTLNADDNEGDYAREAFTLSTNDWVIVTFDFSTSSFSTSTMPTTAAQGLTATGYAKINCQNAK